MNSDIALSKRIPYSESLLNILNICQSTACIFGVTDIFKSRQLLLKAVMCVQYFKHSRGLFLCQISIRSNIFLHTWPLKAALPCNLTFQLNRLLTQTVADDKKTGFCQKKVEKNNNKCVTDKVFNFSFLLRLKILNIHTVSLFALD